MAATYEPIATTTLSSTAASITLSSIPQTYTDLKIIAVLRGTTANTTMNYDWDTNNTADWGWQYMRGDGTTATGGSGANGSNMNAFQCPAATSATGLFSVLIVECLNYTDTSKYRAYLASSARDMNGSGRIDNAVCTQIGTTAVSSFILNASDSFAIGTTVSIYGIKAG